MQKTVMLGKRQLDRAVSKILTLKIAVVFHQKTVASQPIFIQIRIVYLAIEVRCTLIAQTVFTFQCYLDY